MRRRCFVLSVLVGCVPAVVFAGKPTGSTFTSFDVPGATYTRGGDINNGSTIVGYFNDAVGIPHGDVDSGGAFTQIDEPGATAGTLPQEIDDPGTIVGRYDALLFGECPRLYSRWGNFASFDVPVATFTAARGISPAGDVVGYYEELAGVYHGFILSGGHFTKVDYPNTTFIALSGMNRNQKRSASDFFSCNGETPW